MPSIAARVAAVRRKPAHWMFGVPARLPAASLPIGGQDDPIGLTVEIFVNGGWEDISAFVYYRGGARVRITRGRPNETSQIQPQTCTFVINNRDGRFSPRNPVGPYYGSIGRNTPIRVSRLQNGIRRFRFYGEVPTWPTQYDITGTDVYASVTAAGQMRRLTQGAQPLGSTMYRTLGLGIGLGTGLVPVAYWPCEDGQHSSQIASGLTGGTAMALSGQASPTFASNSDFPSSAALPLLSASIWTGQIPATTTPANGLGFLMSIPATGGFDGGVLMRLYTSGTIARLDWVYAAASSGSFALIGYDSTGAQLFTTGNKSPALFAGFTGFNGLPSFIDMTIESVGGGNIFAGAVFASLMPATGMYSNFAPWGATIAGTIGQATSVVVNPDGHFNDTAIGHVVYSTVTNFTGNLGGAFNAWITEPPVLPLSVGGGVRSQGRFLRLCQEQNVQAAVILASGVNAGDTTTMGYQASDTFPNLVQEAATTSAGLMFEARDQNALVLRERGTLYNQAAKLTLDHSQNQLSGPLVPVDDDALTRNDVTATRINGSSNRQVLATGTLSIQAPPNGVGDYATNYSLSLGSDALVADQAGWRLHLGTVDAPRFPTIPINLRHGTFTSNVDLLNAALTIDIGDRLVITNPPAWMPPDPISLILQGYTEVMGIWEHDMVFNCSPEDPYRVGLADDTVLGHADTDGSTLALAAGPADGTLSVKTTTAGSPLWTTTAGDFPFDVNIGGERVTVTNITGAASPQTFTVTRSVNGIVKAQTAGTDVRLWQPMYLSL